MKLGGYATVLPRTFHFYPFSDRCNVVQAISLLLETYCASLLQGLSKFHAFVDALRRSLGVVTEPSKMSRAVMMVAGRNSMNFSPFQSMKRYCGSC